MKKYKCVKDLQNTDFAINTIATANEWKNIALNWAENISYFGDSQEIKKMLHNFKTEKELINFIADFWDLIIIEI